MNNKTLGKGYKQVSWEQSCDKLKLFIRHLQTTLLLQIPISHTTQDLLKNFIQYRTLYKTIQDDRGPQRTNKPKRPYPTVQDNAGPYMTAQFNTEPY